MSLSARRTLRAAALALACVALAYALFSRPSPRPVADAGATDFSAFRYAWDAGTAHAYAFEWTGDQSQALMGNPITGRTRITGTLVLESRGPIEGTADFDVRASFRDLKDASLRLLEQEILPDEAAVRGAFDGHEAFLRVDARGHISSIGFREGAPDVFMHLAQWFLARLQVVVPESGGAAFIASEPHALGVAELRYEATGPLRLSRTLLRLHELRGVAGEVAQHIESKGHVAFAPEGHLLELADDEAITLVDEAGASVLRSHTTFSIRHAGVRPPRALAARPAHLRERTLGTPVVGDVAARRALAQRVEGMTQEQMKRDLLAYGGAGMMPQHSRWLWRTTGLLLASPQAASVLGDVFAAEALGRKGHELVVDLLASAGTREAQAVMREILSRPATRADPDEHMMLLQRFAFVDEPDKETLAFLRAELERAPPGSRLRVACLYTIGAAIGRLGEHDESVGPHEALLLAELAADREGAIRALGNAGFERHVDAIAARSSDPREEVRASVAAALRKTRVSSATRALLALSNDASIVVQRTAYQSLSEHPLDAATLAEIAPERCAAENLETLANVLASAPQQDEATHAAVTAQLRKALARADAVGARDVAGRLRTILEKR